MIGANNCDPNQRLGAHSAHFTIFAGAVADFFRPLAGPKTIRRIVVVTGDNAAVAGLVMAVTQSVGGDVIGAAKAVDLAANTVVTWEESELDTAYKTMDSTQQGIAFELSGAAPANYSLDVEVIYDSGLLAGLEVCQNQDVEGL